MKKNLALALCLSAAVMLAACGTPASSAAPASSAPASSMAASSASASDANDPAATEANTATAKSAVEKIVTLPNAEIVAAGEDPTAVLTAQYADAFSEKGIQSAMGQNVWKEHGIAAENKITAAPTSVEIIATDARHLLYVANVTVTMADGKTQDVVAKGNIQFGEDGKINYMKPVRTVLADVTLPA